MSDIPVSISNKWISANNAPENKKVLTAIIDASGIRNEQVLIKKGRLWFFPDMSMYVYYTPTHWQPLP